MRCVDAEHVATTGRALLAAVQALYQHEMEGTAMVTLLHEFHQHRIGATIEGVEYAEADIDFFDDVVTGEGDDRTSLVETLRAIIGG